jgi:hypothetical protein
MRATASPSQETLNAALEMADRGARPAAIPES